MGSVQQFGPDGFMLLLYGPWALFCPESQISFFQMLIEPVFILYSEADFWDGVMNGCKVHVWMCSQVYSGEEVIGRVGCIR